MTNKTLFSIPMIDAMRVGYERFRLQNISYDHQGLFHDEQYYYAVVADIAINPKLKDELKERYLQTKIIGHPVPLFVSSVSNSMTAISNRTANEKIQLHGATYTHPQLCELLNMYVPKNYQPFWFDYQYVTNEFLLTFKKELTDSEQDEIQIILESNGFQGFDFKFEINEEIQDYEGIANEDVKSKHLNVITSSSFLHRKFSKDVVTLCEKDEDIWGTIRHDLFQGRIESKSEILPNSFLTGKTSCFVDATAFPRQNIRSYLSLYDVVIIAIPLADSKVSDFYQMFGIKRLEMQELILRGRMLFVVPQDLRRYSNSFLNDIISVSSNAIIFSRRLASSTLLGIQQKTGIFGLTANSDEQYSFLKECTKSNIITLQYLSEELAKQWQYLEYSINANGAFATYTAGISGFLGRYLSSEGKDVTIELMMASMSYEFAQGLNAHHFPFDDEKYSEVNACRLISSVYNGVKSSSSELRESELNVLLDNILTINNDMNVLELDDALSSLKLHRLPEILNGFANLSDDEREHKLYKLRAAIRSIENNNERLSAIDLKGFFPVATGALLEMNGLPYGATVGFGLWVANMIKVYSKDSSLLNSSFFSKLQTMNHKSSEDIIIVEQCRRAVSRVR